MSRTNKILAAVSATLIFALVVIAIVKKGPLPELGPVTREVFLARYQIYELCLDGTTYYSSGSGKLAAKRIAGRDVPCEATYLTVD